MRYKLPFYESQRISQNMTPKGLSFIIKDVKKFQEYILPICFKHSNFSSFVWQLNMYNFHKVRGDRLDCQFQHEKFQKRQRELLCKIKRKQTQSFIVSQNIIDDHQLSQACRIQAKTLKNNPMSISTVISS